MCAQRLVLPLMFVLFGSPLLVKTCVAEPTRETADAQRLLAAAEAAKQAFRPIAERDLLDARARLAAATDRLADRLAMDGANGQAWAEYLKLDALRGQIRQTEIDLESLETVYRRFNAGHYGLNRVWFTDVRNALLQTVQVARALEMPELEKAYVQYVEALTTYLRRYVQAPHAEQAVQIGEAIGWLESIGQAPDLIAAVREELARPNLFVAASERLVAAGIEEPVEETEPVRDVILGTDLYGTGRSVGEVAVRLVPNEHHAVLDLTYLGVTRTRNTGYNGPVVVFSRGTTGIGARKRLWVNASGLHSHEARANATTRSKLLDIQPQRGSRLIERVAWRRAMEQKPLAEAIASQHAAARAARKMDARAESMLEETNHDFTYRFRRPLYEHNLSPDQLRFGTGDKVLRVVWRHAEPGQLAAPEDPPPAVEKADLSVRLHQSVVNNAARTLLAGITLSDAEFRMAAVELLGRLPERLEAVPGEEPWGISFDRSRPIEVRFAEGGFQVTIRGRKYLQGDQVHPGMNITARYQIVHDASGFRAVRKGDIEVVPPGLADDQRVGTRYQIVRTLLIRRFGPIFEKEFRLEGLELPGKWSKLGALPVVQFKSDGGWLTLVWRVATSP